MMFSRQYAYLNERLDDHFNYIMRDEQKLNTYMDLSEKLEDRVAILEDQVQKLMDLINVEYEKVPAHTRLVEKNNVER